MDGDVKAPIAVYKYQGRTGKSNCVLIQHGSFQFLSESDQPDLARGIVTLYRGVQKAKTFQWVRFPSGRLDGESRRVLGLYFRVQGRILSDSVQSFNSIHDRAIRCETEHLNDRSECSDGVARECGLGIDGDPFARALWKCHLQSFSLSRWVAQNKFGPNHVVFKTPLTNIRITTFVAGEDEARVIDPMKLTVEGTVGCRVSFPDGTLD